MTEISITKEDFQTYLMCKACDVIGENNYKRFVLRCKDNQEQWAVDMLAAVARVQTHLKEIPQLVQELESQGHSRHARLCFEVGQCVVPPTKPVCSWNLCSITGVRSDQCIDIQRSQKSETVLTVHKDFCHFVQMLWVCLRLENIIKVETKNWIQAQNCPSASIQDLVNAFRADNQFPEQMWELYRHAWCHVRVSIHEFLQSSISESRQV